MTLEQHRALVAALQRALGPDCELIETHISTRLLAGDFAYKLRKPLALGFLDFSTAARRRADCEEELRLNRRTAAQRPACGVRRGGGRGSPPAAAYRPSRV